MRRGERRENGTTCERGIRTDKTGGGERGHRGDEDGGERTSELELRTNRTPKRTRCALKPLSERERGREDTESRTTDEHRPNPFAEHLLQALAGHERGTKELLRAVDERGELACGHGDGVTLWVNIEAEDAEAGTLRRHNLARVEYEAGSTNAVTVFLERGAHTILIHTKPCDVIDVDEDAETVEVKVSGAGEEGGVGDAGEGAEKMFMNGLSDEDGVTPAHGY